MSADIDKKPDRYISRAEAATCFARAEAATCFAMYRRCGTSVAMFMVANMDGDHPHDGAVHVDRYPLCYIHYQALVGKYPKMRFISAEPAKDLYPVLFP